MFLTSWIRRPPSIVYLLIIKDSLIYFNFFLFTEFDESRSFTIKSHNYVLDLNTSWEDKIKYYLLLAWLLLSGLGLCPLPNWPSALLNVNNLRVAWISDAADDTENNDKSVVTDSCEGDRRILHATVNTGVCGVSWFSGFSAEAIFAWSPSVRCFLNVVTGGHRRRDRTLLTLWHPRKRAKGKYTPAKIDKRPRGVVEARTLLTRDSLSRVFGWHGKRAKKTARSEFVYMRKRPDGLPRRRIEWCQYATIGGVYCYGYLIFFCQLWWGWRNGIYDFQFHTEKKITFISIIIAIV